MHTEYPGQGQGGQTPEDGGAALARKLAEILEENKALHDRLAELDISMNIEAVELKKAIEALERERDELTKENEFLLEDYTAKDHRIQELLRQMEIKQLMINETSSYLSTATDRIKNLERQCSNLEAQYAGIYGNRTASEKIDEGTLSGDRTGQGNRLIEDIRREFEETLGQKDLEIETLHRNMEKLKEQNTVLASETAGIAKEQSDTPDIQGPLEHKLLEMEHSLTGLEQRISRASEIGVTEKEEILVKLDDAQREIFSLREYHRSLLEALRATDEEARKGVFSLSDYHDHQSLREALREKEQECEILISEMSELLTSLRDKDETISGLLQRLEQGSQGNSTAEQELQAARDHDANRIEHLETALARERTMRADLEDTMQRKDMILQELHEHFVSDTEKLKADAAEAQEKVQRAEEKIRVLEAGSERDLKEIEALSEQIAAQQAIAAAKAREAEELTEANARLQEDHQLLARTSGEEISALRESLRLRDQELGELTRRNDALEAELRDAAGTLAQQKALIDHADETPPPSGEISRLREENESLSARLQADAAEAQEKAQRAEEKIRVLEAGSERDLKEIEALHEQIAGQQAIAAAKAREAEELTEANARLQEDHQLLARTSGEEISALRESVRLRDQELGELTRRNDALEAELRDAAGTLAQQKALIDHADETPPPSGEISRLREENESLSARLAEVLQKAATLEDIRASVALEIQRLSEKMDLLKNEDMADRAALKNDIDKSFTMIAESAERLEQAITAGLQPVKRPGEGSEAQRREDLPAVYTAVPQDPERIRQAGRGRQLAAAITILLLVITAAVFFRQGIYRALAERGLLTTEMKPPLWETGTKQTKNGPYEITVTFLNKEAVQVLGFSDIISETGLMHNTFALLEIRSSGGCIPADFIASPENNISFLDERGAAMPLNDPGALSGWKKTIHKQGACIDKKAGAVYLKHIISAKKDTPVKGLAVRGLVREPILFQ